MFEDLQCIKSGTFQLFRQGSQKPYGHGPAGAVHIPSQSISSALLLIQFSKPCCPSLLPLSAHHAPPSSPFPLDSSQPFSPIYSHWVSTNWATWTCSVDWYPCVQQPALLQAQSPRLLCCFRHFASKGSPAAPLSGNGHDGGSLVGSCQQTSTKRFHRPIIWPDGGALSVK